MADQKANRLFVAGQAPEDGLYENVPAPVYHSWPVCSNSRLTTLDQGTPKNVEHERKYPKTQTLSLKLGSAIHTSILQPELFHEQYIVSDQCAATVQSTGNRCENPGKHPCKDGNWYCGQHCKGKATIEVGFGIEVLSVDQMEQCVGAREAVWGDRRAAALLEQNDKIVEVSGVITDKEFGIRKKMRNDLALPGIRTIADLKSTDSIKKFRASLFRFGYHRQGAFYLDFHADLADLGFSVAYDTFVLIVVEKKPPFNCHVMLLDPQDIDWGRGDIKRLMKDYARCEKADFWPTYGYDWQKQQYVAESIALNDFDRRKIQEAIDKGENIIEEENQ